MANNDLVQALLRGIDILRHLSASENGLRVNELAEAIGVKPPAAYNLLRTLAARGLVEKRNSKYQLGPGIEELLRRNSRNLLMREGKASLQALAELIPEATLTLSELIGDEVRPRLRYVPDQPGLIQEPAAMTYRPYSNASSLVFQAFADADVCDHLRDRYPFDEYGAPLWQNPENLALFLSGSRKKGYVLMPSRERPRLVAAFPVFGPGHQIMAALGVSKKTTSEAESVALEESYLRQVGAAARDLAQKLSQR